MASKWNADREPRNTGPNTIKIVSSDTGEDVWEIKIESITKVATRPRPPTINIRKLLKLKHSNNQQEQTQDD